MTSELPPGLRSWAASLAFLDVEAALHLGPLVRRLDTLVRRHDAHESKLGEPDGYGDISRRGHPEQMLLSEWLLAEEVPLEFLRRAAARELLHVAPARKSLPPQGSVAVLADTGPDQVGAPRLVQLAALIVLHRRAQARGSELMLGVTSEPPDVWHTGALAEQYEAWRGAHDGALPDRAHVDARRARLDVEDELWILAGDGLAAVCADLKLVLATREIAWDADATVSVEMSFEGRRTSLAVPGGPVAVRTLRGRILRRGRAGVRVAAAGPLSCPSFAGGDRRLVLRGARLDELVTITVPTTASGGAGKRRTHRFDGDVIAAASVGRRLVAVLRHDDWLGCAVIGKNLGHIVDLRLRVQHIDGMVPAGDAIGDGLPAVFYDRGDLLCDLAGTWWELAVDRPPRDSGAIAVGVGHHLDIPNRVYVDRSGLLRDDSADPIGFDVTPSALRVIVGRAAVAWSVDARWNIRGRNVKPATISVPEDCDVIGIVTHAREANPALVTRSHAGALVRLHTETAAKTLTRWSGVTLAHAVHPTLPLIAVQRAEDHVEIGGIEDGEVLATVTAK